MDSMHVTMGAACLAGRAITTRRPFVADDPAVRLGQVPLAYTLHYLN